MRSLSKNEKRFLCVFLPNKERTVDDKKNVMIVVNNALLYLIAVIGVMIPTTLTLATFFCGFAVVLLTLGEDSLGLDKHRDVLGWVPSLPVTLGLSAGAVGACLTLYLVACLCAYIEERWYMPLISGWIRVSARGRAMRRAMR